MYTVVTAFVCNTYPLSSLALSPTHDAYFASHQVQPRDPVMSPTGKGFSCSVAFHYSSHQHV
jgi:hypothetical protein